MGYKKLFWGFIFLFDLRIMGFDIMPDIIGYIFFYQGLTMLEESNKHFVQAKRFAFPMIYISILNIYQVSVSLNEWDSSLLGMWGISMAILTNIIGILMVYNICVGIASEAKLINDAELESKANNRWRLYLVANILTVVAVVLPVSAGIMFLPIIILSLVSYLFMLGLMSAASSKLEEKSIN